jgi:DNA primase
LKEAAGDPIKRAALIKEIVGSIALIPEGITRLEYIKECSSMMDIQEQALINSLNRLINQRERKKSEAISQGQEIELKEGFVTQTDEFENISSESQERNIIRLLLSYHDHNLEILDSDQNGHEIRVQITVAKYIIEEIRRDEIIFNNPVYQRIFNIYNQTIGSNEDPLELLADQSAKNDILRDTINDLQIFPYELSENWGKNRILVSKEEDNLLSALDEAILSFKEKTISRMIMDIQKQLKDITNDEDLMVELAKIKTLKNISIRINNKLGRIITK